MWFEFFIIGGLWWWLLTAGLIAGLVAFTEHDSGSGATVLFGAYLAVIWLFGDFQPLSWLAEHPKTALASIVLYFVIGTGYATFRWSLYTYDKAGLIKLAEEKFKEKWTYENSVAVERHNRTMGEEVATLDSAEAYRRDWLDHARSKDLKLDSLKIRDHKSRYVTWLSYWPASGLWFLASDPVRRLSNWIYNRLNKVLQSISDRAYSGITR